MNNRLVNTMEFIMHTISAQTHLGNSIKKALRKDDAAAFELLLAAGMITARSTMKRRSMLAWTFLMDCPNSMRSLLASDPTSRSALELMPNAEGAGFILAVDESGTLRFMRMPGAATTQTEPEVCGTNIRFVTACGNYALGITRDDTLVSWGKLESAERHASFVEGRLKTLGDRKKLLRGIRFVSLNQGQGLAVDHGGRLWAWGMPTRNSDGRSMKPTIAMNDVAEATGGLEHAIALKLDGTVWGLGINFGGQLACHPGVMTHSFVPVKIMDGIQKIATGGMHNLALGADGIVHGWGANESGESGAGPGIAVAPITQVLTEVRDIAAVNWESYAIRNDGTLWAWGTNLESIPIHGSRSSYRKPTQIGVNIARLHTTSRRCYAVRHDGTFFPLGDVI